jgi:hypothetical protein
MAFFFLGKRSFYSWSQMTNLLSADASKREFLGSGGLVTKRIEKYNSYVEINLKERKGPSQIEPLGLVTRLGSKGCVSHFGEEQRMIWDKCRASMNNMDCIVSLWSLLLLSSIKSRKGIVSVFVRTIVCPDLGDLYIRPFMPGQFPSHHPHYLHFSIKSPLIPI